MANRVKGVRSDDDMQTGLKDVYQVRGPEKRRGVREGVRSGLPRPRVVSQEGRAAVRACSRDGAGSTSAEFEPGRYHIPPPARTEQHAAPLRQGHTPLRPVRLPFAPSTATSNTPQIRRVPTHMGTHIGKHISPSFPVPVFVNGVGGARGCVRGTGAQGSQRRCI